MKLLLTFLGLLSTSAALGQLVHPAGAPVTTVAWQQATPSDSLALDVDGDNSPDVSFRSGVRQVYLPGDTPAMQLTLSARPRHNGTQLAADSANPYAVRRFQPGEVIRHGLQWKDYSPDWPYLEYSYYYGSSTTGGFFSDGQPGYLVVRKLQAGNRWRYWWVHVVTRAGTNRLISVEYFGTTLGAPLAATAPAAAPNPAFPNPSRTSWVLPAGANGAYSLFDALGRLVGHGNLSGSQPTVIEARTLPAGLYLLRYSAAGQPGQQRLIRE